MQEEDLVLMSITGVVQVSWFILTHHGVPYTPKNNMIGCFSGNVHVIFYKNCSVLVILPNCL